MLAHGPGPARRLAGRYDGELPSNKVVSFDASALFNLAAYQLFKRAGARRRADFFLAEAAQFAYRVGSHLVSRHLDERPGVLLGCKTASLEAMQRLDGAPIVKVLDQFDTAAEHARILMTEWRKWAGWSPEPYVPNDRLLRRWEEEWRICDVVFANSEFTKSALVKQGVPEAKIAIGPLAYERPIASITKGPRSSREPLRVLWVASVNLGKGIQYLIEAARSLDAGRFEFTVVGGIEISRLGLEAAPPNMRFAGLVPRSETARYYREADVYVLPTLSDGFAITQIEAMAHGLPVVTTPNCGHVVTHGVDGLIVAAGDSDALRSALDRLERNRDEVATMSRTAPGKARQFTLENATRQMVDGIEAAFVGRERARAGGV